jgi:transcriptional regulator with XRE-family HTH domain
VNYKDNQDELNNEIVTELSELIEGTNERFPVFSTYKQLQSFLRKLAVRQTVRNLPFASFLRQFRRSVDVPFDDFAKALNITPAILEQLESRDALPWNIDAAVIASIAQGLRLHIVAVEELAKNSLVIATLSRKVPDRDTAERTISHWLQAVRTEFERRGAHELLQ